MIWSCVSLYMRVFRHTDYIWHHADNAACCLIENHPTCHTLIEFPQGPIVPYWWFCSSIRYDTLYLRALKGWRDGQLNVTEPAKGHAEKKISRAHEIASRYHEMLPRAHEIKIKFLHVLSRAPYNLAHYVAPEGTLFGCDTFDFLSSNMRHCLRDAISSRCDGKHACTNWHRTTIYRASVASSGENVVTVT